MFWPQRAYGYSLREDPPASTSSIGGISCSPLPYAIVTALASRRDGLGRAWWRWRSPASIANLHRAQSRATRARRSNDLLQRLASLTNIGKTISLRYTTDELLLAIYTECKTVIDCTLFTIALLDESTNELSFELDVRDGQILPKERIPLGEGSELLGRPAPPAAAHRQHGRGTAIRRQGASPIPSRPSRGWACR